MININILICSGHTLEGKGTGAVGYITESRENRILSKKIVEYINKTNHKATYAEVNKSDTYLKDQVDLANKGNYDLVVQVHFNANKTILSGFSSAGNSTALARLFIINKIPKIKIPRKILTNRLSSNIFITRMHPPITAAKSRKRL